MLVILVCDIVLDWVKKLERERCYLRVLSLAIPLPALRLIGVNPYVTPLQGSQWVCTAA
jgi:hypothetical protein